MRYTVHGPPGSLAREALACLLQRIRPRERLELRDADTISVRDVECGEWIAVVDQMTVAAASAAIAEGALGVISLKSSVRDLRDALDALDHHRSAELPHELLLELARSVGAAAANASPTLRVSPRQVEVLERLASGFTNREIAEDLGISENTVRAHLQALALRLDVPASRGKIVARARALGIEISEIRSQPAPVANRPLERTQPRSPAKHGAA